MTSRRLPVESRARRRWRPRMLRWQPLPVAVAVAIVSTTPLQLATVALVPLGNPPRLRLPWPTGERHYIDAAGSGYGCDAHVGPDLYALDFQLETGDPVAAAAGGPAQARDAGKGYGNVVWIDHGSGWITVYAHLESFSGLFPRIVAAGEIIGFAGMTGGTSTGPHLHFALRRQAAGWRDGEPAVPEPMSGYTGFSRFGRTAEIGAAPGGTCKDGETSPDLPASEPEPGPTGGLERASRVAGGVRVWGWADPGDALDIQVVSGRTGRALRLEASSSAGTGEPRRFSVHVPVRSDAPVCAVAADATSPSRATLLGCTPVTVGETPIGHLDSGRVVPGGIQVRGWVLDPRTPAPVGVQISAGDFVIDAIADVPRPDVGEAFPENGERHGFDVVVPARRAVQVCVHAAAGGGPDAFRTLGCTTPSLPRSTASTGPLVRRWARWVAELVNWILTYGGLR